MTCRGEAWAAAGTASSPSRAMMSSLIRICQRSPTGQWRPGCGTRVRCPPMTAIVDTPEQAAALALPPLLVRRPLEAFLDAHGLGEGPLEAEPVGEGHSNVTYLIQRAGGAWVLRR